MKEPKKEEFGFYEGTPSEQGGWTIEGGEDAYFEALKKYRFQRDLKSVYAQIKNLVEDLEGAELSKVTNSVTGSQHWFNTMLAVIKHIGEFMENHELTKEQRETWGKQLQSYCSELIANYHKIPFEK